VKPLEAFAGDANYAGMENKLAGDGYGKAVLQRRKAAAAGQHGLAPAPRGASASLSAAWKISHFLNAGRVPHHGRT